MTIERSIWISFIIAILLFFSIPLHAESLSTGADDEAKIGVCHNIFYDGKGKLLFVSKNAVEAHLNHGDTTRFQVLGDGSTCKKVEEEKRPSGEQRPQK